MNSKKTLFAVALLVFLTCRSAYAQSLGSELVINGGAETGDTTGWLSGGIEAVVPDAGASGFGDFSFTGGTGPATSQTLQQDFDISIWASDIDNGVLSTLFNLQLQARIGGGFSDTANATLFYLDEFDSAIDSVIFVDDFENVNALQWDFHSDVRTIPFGTRSLSVLLETSRTGGSSSDGFFDEVSLSVVSAVPEPSSTVLVMFASVCAILKRRRTNSIPQANGT